MNTKKQHFIPCMLLKNWSLDDKGRKSKIYCYDLHNKKSFKVSVDSICFENNLYEADVLKNNSIENYLATFESTIWNYLVQKCINSEPLNELEIQGLYLLTTQFFLRSPFMIHNLNIMNINKATYLLKALVITKQNDQEIYNQVLESMSYESVFVVKIPDQNHRQFLINNLLPVIPVNYEPNLTQYDWIFPISYNTCIFITSNKQMQYIDDVYAIADDDFIDYVNSYVINMRGIRFIYSYDSHDSRDSCNSYIESLRQYI